MFQFAFLLGIYSYVIFFLGLSGWLYKEVVVGVTVLWLLIVTWRYRRKWIQLFDNRALLKSWKKHKLVVIFGLLLSLQVVVNLIGALGPELGFDALWYHLTLPKLWLLNHSIAYIPGGLLYYSVMPKFAETLYIGGLSLGNEITVKLIHFGFGLLTCFALYKLSRKFFSPLISLIALVIFYANLVVGWESIAAYVDLVRAFFEVMALWAFINWVNPPSPKASEWQGKQKWLVWSAIMVGLALTTKVLAVGSLLIFVLLIIFSRINEIKKLRWVKEVGIFGTIALVVPLPWFVFSYVNTGNPFYPLLSPYLSSAEAKVISLELLNPIHFISVSWDTFLRAADPLSPVYLMFLPLLFFYYKKLIKLPKIIFAYCLGAFIFFYITSGVEGTRMLLPYLPAFSLLCAAIVDEVLDHKKTYGVVLGKLLLVIIIGISLISISYRFVANKKYLPIILGTQTKEQFLTENLNFDFGDFYDIDGYFKENIQPTDRVLLYGFHNLYYVEFPFVDSTWIQAGELFNYIATQNTELPQEYRDWKLVHENEKTMVKLYQKPERLYTYR